MTRTGRARRADTGASPAGLAHPRHWPSWLGLGLLSLALLVPRILRDRMAALGGDLQYRFNAKRRAIVGYNLQLCYPARSDAEREAMARAHFRAYVGAMLDMPVVWWDWRRRVPSRLCEVQGLERLLDWRRAGRSVILLNPHTTAVDFGGIALTPYVRVSTMANALRNPVLDWIVTRSRRGYDADVFLRHEGLRPAVRELRRGTTFYYMPDEDFGDRDSVFAPFFGHEKATLKTVARLARASGAVVLPMYAYYDRSRRRYQVVIRPALADFPTGEPRRDAAIVNRAMETAIALCPEAYLWQFRLFKTRPDGTRRKYPTGGRR